jgi:hypothetical protein
MEHELLSVPVHMCSPPLFFCVRGFRVVRVVKLHVITFLVPCCDVRYDFCVETMLDSS